MTTDATGPAEPDESGLDELSQARLAEGRALLADLMTEDAWQREAMEAERDYSKPGWDEGPAHQAYWAWDEGTWLAPLSVEQRRCLLFATAEFVARGDQHYSRPSRYLGLLTQQRLSLVVGDVRLLAALCEPGQEDGGYEPFAYVLDFLEQLLAAQALGAAALAGSIADQVGRWNPTAYYWHGADYVLRASEEYRQEHISDIAEFRDRALALAGRPPAPPALEGMVSRDDGWGQAAITRLGVLEDWPPGVAALIEHCALAKATRPGSRWNKVGRQRLEAIAEPAELLRDLLELILATEPASFLTEQGRRALLIGFNEQLIKGLVWAAGLLDPPWLPPVLQAVAVRCLRLCSGHVFRKTAVPGEKIPNACFHALASSGSDASLIALARIGRATTNGSVLNHLARILQEVSAQRGLSPDSLLDYLTPDHGLDSSGQLTIQTEADPWTIRLDDRHGAVAEGPPGLGAPQEVIDATAEIKATVSTVRDRLDGLLSNHREWHVTDFTDGYVRHPLVGWLARRLVWTYTTPGGDPRHGFPDAAGAEVITPQGTFQAPVDGLVRLTHPVLLTGTEVGQLRRLGQELAITQPIRQLWRETYQLTDDERRQGLFSDRYAGHILRFSHGYGLARRRGWTGGFLSAAWDGGDTAIARRDYPSAGLRASWALRDVDGVPGEVAVGLCETDRLSFSPLGEAYGAPVPLADVPADVFSEAMRDLDLVVSVATVANDPAWFTDNRFHPGIDEYWKRIAEGGFVQFRSHRREVLAEFFDGLTSEQEQRLTAADLIVHGSLATYRIDLATANVRMEPGGKYLSFDTKLSPQAEHDRDALWLPAFDDDEILRRILIRAAILADDEHLASRKLLRQIRG